MHDHISRRKFLRTTSISSAGFLLSGNISRFTSEKYPASQSFNVMREILRYRKINAHEHCWLISNIKTQLDYADRLGIEKLEISKPISDGGLVKATSDECIKSNDVVLQAMKLHPDRYLGSCYINPLYQKESLEEINRCIGEGMIGLKVYNQVKINDPLFYPIIEKFISHKMIILMHSHCGIGIGGKRTEYGNQQPNVSVPEDFVEAATRYPEAMFQYAHTGGGGDWEYACKMLSPFPNIYVDTSGSNNEGNMIDFALKYVGEDRLLYGSDGSYYQSVGTILSSKLNETQRKKIFFENFNNILKKSGRNVD